MPQLARIDEEDADLSDEERAEALKIFRPVRLLGARPTDIREAALALQARAEGEPTRNLRTPSAPPHPVGLSSTQTLFWGLVAVSAGVLVGWFWRKHREAAAREKARVIKATKPRDLLGLDVVTSCL